MNNFEQDFAAMQQQQQQNIFCNQKLSDKYNKCFKDKQDKFYLFLKYY